MIIFLKTQEEIEGFRRAGREAARILKILFEKTCAGMTTMDLDEIMRAECQQIDATPTFLGYNGFPASICTSVNKVLVHGIPNARRLESGDLLSIDLGVTIDGFIGDTARTISVPTSCFGSHINPFPTDWEKYLYGFAPIFVTEIQLVLACREALRRGIDKATAGNRLSDISGAICEVANKHKFSMPVQYGGHGINRFSLHSQPFIPNDPQLMEEDVTLCPGMVLAIEPMFIDSKSNRVEIMADGWSVIAQGNAAHFEHTIVVTDGDPLILTEEGF
jgi:methionyl aminopeptidase